MRDLSELSTILACGNKRLKSNDPLLCQPRFAGAASVLNQALFDGHKCMKDVSVIELERFCPR